MKLYQLIPFLILLFFVTGCSEKPIATLSFLSCKDADVSVVVQKDHVIMIDTGEKTCQEEVISFLTDHKIDTIEVLILTHSDKDHIGNALKILQSVKVEQILATDYQKGSKLETELLQFIQKHHVNYQVVKQPWYHRVGEMELSIIPPKKQYDSSNNSSLVTLLKIGEITTFFGADIKQKRIEELTDIGKVELVKLPYHGRYISNLDQLLYQLDPEYIIIPTEEIEDKTKQLLERLKYRYQKTPVTIEINENTWKKR